MDTRILAGGFDSEECDVLVVLAPERAAGVELTGHAATFNRLSGGMLQDLYDSGEFSGKTSEVVLLHRPAGVKAKRVAIVGAGATAKFGSAEARRAAATVVRQLKTSTGTTCFAVDDAHSGFAGAFSEGAVTALWEQDFHKSTGRRENKLSSTRFVVSSATPDLETSLNAGRITAECQNFARDLVNEPGNLLPPRELVRRAKEMAEQLGLEIDVLDKDRMSQLGMGSLLGVAQGSAEPPFLIVLKYVPEKPAKTSDHLGLVGKGVTFDTGGISLKPADGMEKMKCDMAGGAAMLGTMRALAQLKPSIPVTAFVPTVENMPGSRAQRPGDIVRSLAGKTIEVLNTDAEGRLILIDAITYAKQQGCTHLVDAATLTGAIGVALGSVHAGAFTNNQEFLDKVIKASKAAGENLWPMPTDDDYRDQLKSAYADIANIGGRAGGACTAAVFLKEWVEDTPWVHLDIALTAYLDEAKPFCAKGATGFGVRTFVNLAMNW
ncbi:putative cytosol aminopeptidase [Bryobacterales bacterium F-183]|nr:putative cytosol aminopeptidase [Bryobacterales bacterium F-183]